MSAQGLLAPWPPDDWQRMASRSSCWSGGSGPTARRCGSGSPTSSCGREREWLWRPELRQGVGDQPIDEQESDVSALMWNGVGGSMLIFAGQWHRNMPSDFKLRSTEGIADDWPLNYEELVPYYRRIERDFGISGLNGDPAFPGNGLSDAAAASARVGRSPCAGTQRAGLALVARIQRDRHAAVRAAPGVHGSGVMHVWLSGAGEVLARSHPLAGRPRAWRAARHAGTRDPHRDRFPRPRDRRRLRRSGRRHAPTARERRDPRGQRRGHPVAAALLGLVEPSGGPGQFEWAGRPSADGAPVRRRRRSLRGPAVYVAEPGGSAAVFRAVLRDG